MNISWKRAYEKVQKIAELETGDRLSGDLVAVVVSAGVQSVGHSKVGKEVMKYGLERSYLLMITHLYGLRDVECRVWDIPELCEPCCEKVTIRLLSTIGARKNYQNRKINKCAYFCFKCLIQRVCIAWWAFLSLLVPIRFVGYANTHYNAGWSWSRRIGSAGVGEGNKSWDVSIDGRTRGFLAVWSSIYWFSLASAL